MAFNNVIQWYESAALDQPELRSPTPCPRGVYCQYKLQNKDLELELACCRMVHPGEEGNGRRLFPARTAPDGRHQPACVRLTGKADFYERCRLKQPWRVWAAEHGIPLPPADIPWVQVVRGPIQRGPKKSAIAYSENTGASSVAPSAAVDSPIAWPCLQNRAALSAGGQVVPPPALQLGGLTAPCSYEISSPQLGFGPPRTIYSQPRTLEGPEAMRAAAAAAAASAAASAAYAELAEPTPSLRRHSMCEGGCATPRLSAPPSPRLSAPPQDDIQPAVELRAEGAMENVD
jgi:hypothetical protein